ncbi:MAG: hypothetical protein OXI87_19600 [Albidovulum sp.]|nr:hypothetical protein [Albidovulum sp.]
MDTIIGEKTFENQNSAKFSWAGPWLDGVFRGAKGSKVERAVPVRLEDGW